MEDMSVDLVEKLYDEKAAFAKSADAVRNMNGDLNSILA
jgi:hypothetical protein